MAIYRAKRNIEASVIDFLTETFAESGGYSNIVVEKTFKNIYEKLVIDSNKGKAAICVRVLSTKNPKIEIGTNAIWKTSLVMLDIFATSDGQREDLADYIVYHVKYGIPYYKYTITNGEVSSKILSGRLRITIDGDTPVNFNTDKSALAVADRYRHALSLSATMSNIEE